MDTQTSVVEEAEDEEVTYGEDRHGVDWMSDDDDFIRWVYQINIYPGEYAVTYRVNLQFED